MLTSLINWMCLNLSQILLSKKDNLNLMGFSPRFKYRRRSSFVYGAFGCDLPGRHDQAVAPGAKTLFGIDASRGLIRPVPTISLHARL